MLFMHNKLNNLHTILKKLISGTPDLERLEDLIKQAGNLPSFNYNNLALYTIEPGDNAETINQLAEHNKFFLDKILQLNPTLDLNNLQPGKLINIPPKQNNRNQPMNFSAQVINFIKKYDGVNGSFLKRPMVLPSGYMLVGYGHKIDKSVSPKQVKPIQSDEEAEGILINDLNSAADFIRKHVSQQLSQNQFDALTAHIFDLGIGRGSTSPVVKYIMLNDFNKASQVWSNAISETPYGNKKTRRAAEVNLFNS